MLSFLFTHKHTPCSGSVFICQATREHLVWHWQIRWCSWKQLHIHQQSITISSSNLLQKHTPLYLLHWYEKIGCYWYEINWYVQTKVPFCKRSSSAFNYVKVCYPVCLSDDNKNHLSPCSSLTLLAMSWPLCWHRMRRDMKELPAEITAKNSTYPSTDGWLRHSLAHFVVSSNRMIHDICCFFCFIWVLQCYCL